jgi:drug/metabolite transporter (DMT)-like permease
VTIDGRFIARAVMGLAGVALLVLGAFSYDSNRITLRDVIGLAVCVVVFAVAALWYRRESRQHGGRHRQ